MKTVTPPPVTRTSATRKPRRVTSAVPRLLFTAVGLAALSALAVVTSWPVTASATPAKDFASDLTRSFFEKIRVISGTETDVDHDDSKGNLPFSGHGERGSDHDQDRDHDWDHDRDRHERATVKIIARDPSDVYVVTNTVLPGGYSGWHTHPGPSVVLVKTGTATVYDGDDPSCTPVTYPAGTGFIDAGGGHVHMVRNEGTATLVTEAFQIIPTGEARRIDAPSPGNCPF